MSFVCQPSVVPAGDPAAEDIITNDGFFPNVDPAKLRLQVRLSAGVVSDRLREAVLSAMMTLENDLASWRDAHIAAGRETLTAVPGTLLGGEKRLVLLYRRAMGCLVRAELIERQRDLDTTGAGDRRIDALDSSVDELRRDASFAVRDMLGRSRIVAELI